MYHKLNRNPSHLTRIDQFMYFYIFIWQSYGSTFKSFIKKYLCTAFYVFFILYEMIKIKNLFVKLYHVIRTLICNVFIIPPYQHLYLVIYSLRNPLKLWNNVSPEIETEILATTMGELISSPQLHLLLLFNVLLNLRQNSYAQVKSSVAEDKVCSSIIILAAKTI